MLADVTIWTIGHSTRTHEELFDLLAEHDIERLIDVRSYPSSRHCPQWNKPEIAKAAAERGLRYNHLVGLGGKRRPLEHSINSAWRNDSFRGYADYMQTQSFKIWLEWLMAYGERSAIMCSEVLWWRCHRSMIADALVANGHEVIHIMGPGKSEPHRLRDFAVVDSGRVFYPKEPHGAEAHA